MGFAYNKEFDPVLLPGETATLKGAQFPEAGQPIICAAFLALPEYQKDFGALTAATSLSDQEDSNLELGGSEFAQMRMQLLDDFKLQLKNPAPVELWRSARVSFYLRKLPTDPGLEWLAQLMWRMSEFYVWQDDTPRFNLYSEAALSSSRVIFRGWKFKVREITEKELTSKQVILINSWPAGK